MNLAEYWARASHLEHQPLHRLVTRASFSGEEAAVFFREIKEDGTGFEQIERFAVGSVMIDDRGNFAIGIQFNERVRMLFTLADIDRMCPVFQAQFLEHY